MTLVEFLLARIEQSERNGRHSELCRLNARLHGAECMCTLPRQLSDDCGGKRRIIEMHAPVGFWDIIGCEVCSGYEMEHETWSPDGLAPGEVLWPCETLRLLALPYAGHADYQSEWAPTSASSPV